jgi:hypothetical protein
MPSEGVAGAGVQATSDKTAMIVKTYFIDSPPKENRNFIARQSASGTNEAIQPGPPPYTVGVIKLNRGDVAQCLEKP